MSQLNVERVVGLLVTDEAMRRSFEKDPRATLERLCDGGLGLTHCERQALASLDPAQLARFAQTIDPRIQKADLKCGECP